MPKLKRIGVLTGGGDAPGLNAVIRAVVKSGVNHGIEVVGLEDSFDGLIEPNRSRVLTARAVMDTAVRGDEADCGCGTATPDMPFADLCALSARLSHPVAVLDGKGVLVGVVPQRRLIGFLGDRDGRYDRDGRPDPQGAAPVPCDAPRDKAVRAVKASA